MVHSAQRSNSLIRNEGLSNRGLDFGNDSFSRELSRGESVLRAGLYGTRYICVRVVLIGDITAVLRACVVSLMQSVEKES